MLKTDPTILVVGIGNNCRGDDGLGWRFVETVEALGRAFVGCEYRYQLQVEDAELISAYDLVVFADASYETLDKGFEVRACTGNATFEFSTHAQSPEAILKLCNTIFKKSPKAYIVAIGGDSWELTTSLSIKAEKNLNAAVRFFTGQFLPVQHARVCVD